MSTVNDGLDKTSLDITVQSLEAQTFAVLERQPFEVTLSFGAATADEVVALASFISIIKVIFAQMFGINVSMITVSFVEVMSQVPFSSRSAQLEVVC